MSEVRYTVRDTRRITGKDALIVGPELERLMREKGSLTAAEVLAAAESPDSPLHPYFEWDDTEAARKYREEQARQLVRAVVVRVDDIEERAFINIPRRIIVGGSEPEEGSTLNPYVAVRDVIADDRMSEYWTAAALKEVRAWRDRHQSRLRLSEQFRARFQSLFDAIDALDAQENEAREVALV